MNHLPPVNALNSVRQNIKLNFTEKIIPMYESW